MVLKAHFCGIFNRCQRTAEHVIGCGGSHGACHAHFRLATGFCARDAGARLGHVANQAGGGQGVQDAPFGKAAALLYVIEHSGHYARCAARRSRGDLSA